MSSLLYDREKDDLSYGIIGSILYFLFFCSGCSALIYQVIWQRMLFSLFGTDLESITIIVSVFMFGLGVGGLCSGILADAMRTKLLTLYIVVEFGIALFGFYSPKIIYSLGAIGVGSYPSVMALVSFCILAFPTILMGATFPLLVTHISKYQKNIGQCVGSLYFFNTLGAALGAFLGGCLLLNYFDMIEIVYGAAALNLIIAVIAYFAFKRSK